MALLLNKRFRVRRPLGSGTQGTVYLADDRQGASVRAVALKAVPEAHRQSLIREFERLCTLSHPGLARVFELHESDVALEHLPKGSLYFVSEYIEGHNLASDVSRVAGLARVDLLLNICGQVASALSHMHAHGLVHNDIKPDNICRSRSDERVVLLDLGLSGAPGMQTPRGSVAYMAPEALSGLVDPRSDLYSLGATLAEYALGERLFPQQDTKDAIAAILAITPADIAERLAAYPPKVVELVQCLLSSDPSQRPSGANALLAHVARVREALQLADLHEQVSPHYTRPEFVGRASELAALDEVLQAHALQLGRTQRLRIVGERGSGRRRVVDEALLRHQAKRARKRATALRVHRGLVEELWPPACTNASEFLAHYAIAAEAPLLLLLLDDDDPRVDEILATGMPAQVLVIATRSTSASSSDPEISLAGLSAEEAAVLCRSLSRKPIPSAWQANAFRLSQGLPGRLSEFMQAASDLDPDYQEAPDALLVEGSLGASAVRRVASLSPLARGVVEMLSIARKAYSASQLADALGETSSQITAAGEDLVACGFVRSSAESYQLSSEEYAPLIEASLSPARQRALHRIALRVGGGSLSPFQEVAHLLVVGPLKDARQAALLAIDERTKAGRHDQALDLCVRAAGQMSGKSASAHAALTAEVALTTGDYDLAQQYAEKARRSRDANVQRRGVLALARCAQHRGDLGLSTELMAALVKRNPQDCTARASYAKALCAQGDFTDAIRQAKRVLSASAATADQFLAHEVSGLANLFLGQTGSVSEHFEKLAVLADENNDLRLLGRAQGLRGMLAQKLGELAEASQLYADASAKSMESGAHHSAAVFSLNSATIAQRTANYAVALDALQVALRQLARSGTPFQLAAAHCNRGNVLLVLGELAAATEEAHLARTLAAEASDPRLHYYSHLLLGDVAMRRQALADASQHYRDAAEIAGDNQLSDGLWARLALQEVQALRGAGNTAEVRERLEGDSQEQSAKALASHARVLLLLGEMQVTVADELDVLCEELEATQDLDLGWQVAILATRSRQALGHADAMAQALERALRIFGVVLAQTPEAYQAGLRSHPDAQALDALTVQNKRELAMDPQSDTELPLLRLLSLSRRLNSELRMDALLDDIIDTAVELSRAERAFLLLRNDAGELELCVARNIDREDLAVDQQVSRSIAEKVARTGQAILTVDAEQDGRFGASLSIAALQLRSILAVPFRVKSRIVGTLYLDHRFRRGAFDHQAVEVVRELAGIAAVALENARLATGIRQRQTEIDTLNARLETRLEKTEAELAAARAKVPGGRPATGFAGIIGDSPALREVLALAERAADCDLPVVIFGESGTGKELLARAIHENSERRDQAFVALNCGAVPDGLLEAELFGHRKGAFTGADRARQGLFRVADGGTLFLDEIADTSLTMQSKLLRALQDGEIRPLGAEQTVHVDIRVLCASNQRLEALVEAGRFREDLYYRLKVLSIAVPSLSERRGDIEPLANHILAKLGKHARLTRAALRTLQAHAWPGNVRELENELTRAYALADSELIEPSHLSPALQVPLARLPQVADASADGLLLKPQVEALERELVTRAMRECEGNQSKAATLLGLSRFGLQKKLQRYGIARSEYSG